MKKAKLALACCIAGAIAVSFSGCGLFSFNAVDGNTASSVGVESGIFSSVQEFLAAQETPSTAERRMYEEAVEDGYTGTYYQFLEQLELSDDTAYINRAVNAVVEIEASFLIGNTLRESTGSGVIYQLDKEAGEAYVITNYHVIATYKSSGFGPFWGSVVTTDWSDIGITLYGGETIDATHVSLVAGSNRDTDLAVLKIDGSEALRTSGAVAVSMAEAELGERVYAIGNANGEGTSVTRGVVSVLSEKITVTAADNHSLVTLDVMRTDAAVNHGNSGGGLFNAKGELVGIVSARRLSTNGGTEINGFGYAISATDANAVLKIMGCEQIPLSSTTSALLREGVTNVEDVASCVVSIKTDSGAGTGVICELDRSQGDALIVTNYHVLYSTEQKGISSTIDVRLFADAEQTAIAASYVGGVQSEDLALIRIEDEPLIIETACEAAEFASSSSVTLGESVYVIGNAVDEGVSVSEGVVSVVNELYGVASADESTTLIMNGIRTDAAVNHGNSGGGLFNAMGELIGITSAVSEEEGVVGFGCAIPSDRVVAVMQSILYHASQGSSVKCVTLGIRYGVASTQRVFYERTGKVYEEEKVIITSLSSGSLAARMGLDVYDTLLSVSVVRDGEIVAAQSMTAQNKLANVLYAVREGDTLCVVLSRAGKVRECSVVVAASDLRVKE